MKHPFNNDLCKSLSCWQQKLPLSPQKQKLRLLIHFCQQVSKLSKIASLSSLADGHRIKLKDNNCHFKSSKVWQQKLVTTSSIFGSVHWDDFGIFCMFFISTLWFPCAKYVKPPPIVRVFHRAFEGLCE